MLQYYSETSTYIAMIEKEQHESIENKSGTT